MNIGKEWQWPTPEELIEWEAKIKRKNTRAIGPGNQLLLIRAVRGQRKVIEKLAKMLAMGNGSIEGGGDMRGPRRDTIGSRSNEPPATPSDLDSQPTHGPLSTEEMRLMAFRLNDTSLNRDLVSVGQIREVVRLLGWRVEESTAASSQSVVSDL